MTMGSKAQLSLMSGVVWHDVEQRTVSIAQPCCNMQTYVCKVVHRRRAPKLVSVDQHIFSNVLAQRSTNDEEHGNQEHANAVVAVSWVRVGA